MKNKTHSFHTLFICTFLSFMAVSAFATPHDKSHRFEKMKQHLNLNESQAQAVQTMMETNEPKTDAIKQEVKQLKKQIHDLMKGESIDEPIIRELTRQVADKKTSLMLLHHSSLQQLREHLSDEQINKIKRFHHKKARHQRKHDYHH